MKKFIWLLVMVVALLLIAPFGLGIVAERETYRQLELADHNPLFSLKVAEFDRGWFSSDVSLSLGLGDDYLELLEGTSDAGVNAAAARGQATAAPFEIVSTLSHGPIGFQSGWFFGLFRAKATNGPNNPRVNQFLQDANMSHLFIATSHTGFFGKSTLNASVPPVSINPTTLGSDTPLRSVEFSGLTFAGTHQSSSNEVTMSGGGDSFSLVADNVSLGMDGLSMSADFESITSAIAWGEVKTSIDSLSMFDATADNAQPIQVKGVGLEVNTTKGTAPGTADISARYLIDGLNVTGQQLNNIELAVNMQAISVTAMAKYTELNQHLMVGTVQAADNEDPESTELLAADNLQAMHSLVHEFAEQSPTINLDPMQFTTNGEVFRSNLVMHLDGNQLPALDAFDIADIPLWTRMAKLNAGATIGEGLATVLAISNARSALTDALGEQQEISDQQINDMAAAQAPLVIETLVQQGMLSRSDGNLSTKMSLINGEFLLNGQAIPLGALLGRAQIK